MIPLRILWRTGTFVSVKTTPKNIYKQGSICAKFLEENHQNQFKVQFFTTATNFMNKNKGKSSISISPNNKSALFLYKCPKCNFCHEDKFKIKNHLKVVHQAKPYFCQKCHQMVIFMTTYFYPILKICQESFFRNECQLMTKC